ncbi:MAG TPA: hypothetical protein VFI22_09965 [Thermomicrobiales bacterium]|nr:hypothetical protein [Thermomicrobiales bacterium]
MFLGVSRLRMIACGVMIVAGLVIITTGTWGKAGGILGIALVLLALILFGMMPKHHAPPPPRIEPPRPAPPPGPRPEFEARDASDV